MTDFSAYATYPLPVFVMPDGGLALRRECVPGRALVLVCSVPKSGTYFVGDILSNLGFVGVGLHLSYKAVTDYRFVSRTDARNYPDKISYSCDYHLHLPLLRDGQYLVSHLGHLPSIAEALRDVRVIVLYREIRTTLVSKLRFFGDTERRSQDKDRWAPMPPGPARTVAALRDIGPNHLAVTTGLVGWLSEPGVLAISFDDIVGYRGRDRQLSSLCALAAHCGADELNEAGADLALRQSTGQPNKTWSGEITRLGHHWDDQVEAVFAEMGGLEVSRRFGYDEPWQAYADWQYSA